MKPSANLRHLAAASALIGTPWTPRTNCWWLVREFFRRIGGPVLPNVEVGEESPEQVRSIMRVCEAGGLRLLQGAAVEPLDIVLLRNLATDRRHVGVAIFANGALSMLHSEGAVDQEATAAARTRTPGHPPVCTGPGVVCEPFDGALSRYRAPEVWRMEVV